MMASSKDNTLISLVAANSVTAVVGAPAVMKAATIALSLIALADSAKSRFCTLISSMLKPAAARICFALDSTPLPAAPIETALPFRSATVSIPAEASTTSWQTSGYTVPKVKKPSFGSAFAKPSVAVLA